MIVNASNVSRETFQGIAHVKKGKKEYLDVICAFDIETSYLKEIGQSIMYIWQFQIGAELTVVGRTWAEYRNLAETLCEVSALEGGKIVVYVHNLSYEFQFLRGVFSFSSNDVMVVKSRRILKATYDDSIEYRCSYLQTNQSLDSLTKSYEVEHQKLSGDDFDYSIVRYPWTELTAEELNYCVNDVLGLVEAMQKRMALTGDTLATVPLTSTGYVRRDAKKAMRKCSRAYIEAMLPSYEVYKLCREAFRGGNTHANRYYAGQILTNVHSYDRSSSYPDVQVNDVFPISEFQRAGPLTIKELENRIYDRQKACLIRIAFEGLRLKDPSWGCPYISIDKCRGMVGCLADNGRVLKAEQFSITLTDIDYRIIREEYEWSNAVPYDVWTARYGALPSELLEVTIKYYRDKTSLKGIQEEALMYNLSKALLNSIYGMQAQNPVKEPLEYMGGSEEVYAKDPEFDPETYLLQHRKDQFMPYQWGVWVTAWARFRLEEGIKLAGKGFVYCDTDSVKYMGDVCWDKYNAERIESSKSHGAMAADSKGHMHYMGVYEQESDYERFITWGAKKYCYEQNGKLVVTTAGVSKKYSSKELLQKGGLEAFKPGFIFVDAGGVEVKYNDEPFGEYVVTGQGAVEVTTNACLLPSTYTLGITNEYEKLLQETIDFE